MFKISIIFFSVEGRTSLTLSFFKFKKETLCLKNCDFLTSFGVKSTLSNFFLKKFQCFGILDDSNLIEVLPYLSRVESLNLKESPISDISGTEISSICTNLRKLSVSKCSRITSISHSHSFKLLQIRKIIFKFL